jgi:hypothetical protein
VGETAWIWVHFSLKGYDIDVFKVQININNPKDEIETGKVIYIYLHELAYVFSKFFHLFARLRSCLDYIGKLQLGFHMIVLFIKQ